MMPDGAAAHCSNRRFEWLSASILISLGVWLLIFPGSMAASSFRFIKIGIAELTALYLLVGTGRIIALYLNGNWPVYGPMVRALGAFAGACLWLLMALALYVLPQVQGTPPSPGIPVYFGLLIGELIAIHRATADVRYRRR